MEIPLDPAQFSDAPRVLVRMAGLTVTGFRYPTGVAGMRIENARGFVVVLPWMGQIVWDAAFDGVRLTMGSLFDAPRPATEIVETYGCFAFHSGLLRNGCPGPEDTHALHGEMACAAMDECKIEVGDGFARAVSSRLFVRGFGNRYVARASVTLRPGATEFDIGMDVENTGGAPMDLMYMCHVNFGFVPGGRIVQAAPFTPEAVAVRTATPSHVPSSPAHQALVAALARDPSATETLDTRYDPEQVFYLHGLRTDAAGDTHLMLRRPEGDAFSMSFSPAQFPHAVRWLMCNADHQVAAFALPSTCEPEGYAAERRKGNVATIAAGGARRFTVRAGYLDATGAAAREAAIGAL